MKTKHLDALIGYGLIAIGAAVAIWGDFAFVGCAIMGAGTVVSVSATLEL